MMTNSRRIGSHVGAEPFRPFRISLAGGRSSEIRHPEMVRVGRTTMTIFTHQDGEADEHQVEVPLLLAESVEPLEVATRRQGELGTA